MRVVFLSLAAHAVAFALVLRTPRRERAPEPAPLTPIEIVEEDEPPPPPPSGDEGVVGKVAMSVHAPQPRPASAVVAAHDGPTTVPSGEPSFEPSPAPVWSGAFFQPGPNTLATNPFARSTATPRAEEETEKKTTKRDFGLGFGPSSEGPALTAFKDVTSRSLAPLVGRARFTLRANADGDVLGIDIDDATGGPGWDDARRLALEELRGKKIVVPRGARGVNVHFEIVSDVSYPSGQRSKTEIKVFPGGIILPDESNIGQVQTRKIHARHIATEIL